MTIDVRNGQITRTLDQIEQVKTAIPARTIDSLHDLIHHDLVINMSESIQQLYDLRSDDVYRLATSIKGNSPIYLSMIMDKRQAAKDLLSKWFDSRIAIGGKEYMIHLVIERIITSGKEDIEEVKIKKERKSTPSTEEDSSTIQSGLYTPSERFSEAVQEPLKRSASVSSSAFDETPYRTRRRHAVDERDMDRIWGCSPFTSKD
ncbi:uncharacterized protein BDW43DRAFT_304589 [Aspergillus alliaceus]|uniref:uncharacterized protein n=1 Tax=Petromyces alliaceus TaxID=209559 RepID=UPI0012A51965|nr:uncharacterized protein BDW43DRAFT_304589 [Aspergillus alliaceus]KAB8227487.1 hypothetical protein BDW43DRAFT_304589 [Aspergillus alliaceus]